MLFSTLFLSYGITVWGATHGQYLKPVLVSQKKVVRAMTFSDPFAHSLPLFSDLQILKLDDICHLYVSSFVCEYHNNLAPNYFSDCFTLKIQSGVPGGCYGAN